MIPEELKKSTEEEVGRLKQIQIEQNKLSQEERSITESCTRKKINYVYKSGLLQKGLWDIKENYKSFVLTNKSKFEELQDLLATDNHCQVEIEPGVTIRFDDWDISIVFDELSKAAQFIKREKLVIYTASFIEQKKKLKKNLADLENFLSKIKQFKQWKKPSTTRR